jgi:hypothetical protein
MSEENKMNNRNSKQKIAALLIAGAFGLGAATVGHAAESASGVAEYMALTIKTAKQAQESAKQGNKEGCLQGIRETRQHYKEITGDAAGMGLQRAIGKMKTAQFACEAGDTAKGADILAEVVKDLEAVQAKR